MLSALAAGTGAAAALVYISDHWWTLYGLANAFDFLSWNRQGDIAAGTASLIAAALERGTAELSRQLLEFHATPRDYPLQLVCYAALLGCLVLPMRGRSGSAVAAACCLVFAFGLIVLFSVRGYYYYYQIYTEPFFILAAAIVATATIPRDGLPRLTPGLVVGLVLSLAIGLSSVRFNLIAPSTGATRGPEHACCSRDYATLIGRHFQPYCSQATVACPLNWDALRAMPDKLLNRRAP